METQDIKYDAEFDTREEEETQEREISTVVEIFECVKGMVHDSWIMQKGAEEQARQVAFNRSRKSFEPTSQGGSRTNPTEMGSQGTGPGVMMYENVNTQGMHTYNQGMPTYNPEIDPRVKQGISTYGGYDPRLNVHQLTEQQMTLSVTTDEAHETIKGPALRQSDSSGSMGACVIKLTQWSEAISYMWSEVLQLVKPTR